MCFQGFVRFKCNCTALAQDTCQYAKELDVNFWLKVACPNYQTQSKVLDYCCSPQKYYCSKTRDGIVLNRIHQQRDQADRDCKQAEHDYVQRFFPLYNEMAKMWQAKGGLEESFQARPRVIKVCELMQGAKSQRALLLQRITELDGIINAARLANGKLPMGGTSFLQRQVPTPFNPPYMLMPPSHDNPDGVNLMPMLQAPSHPIVPGRLGSSSQRRHPIHDGRPLTADAGYGIARPHAVLKGVPNSKMHEAVGDRHRADMTMEASSSPEKPSSVVRRSARVRDKKVNYAVDDEASSRSPSPQKSDVSTFSPYKSDISNTPTKSRTALKKKEPSSLHEALLRREGLTFENGIDVRKRRDSSIAPVSKREAGSPVKKRKVEQEHGDFRRADAPTDINHMTNLIASQYNADNNPALAATHAANPLRIVLDRQAFGTMDVGKFSGMYSEQRLLPHGHPQYTANSLDEMETLDRVPPLVRYEAPNMEEPVKRRLHQEASAYLTR